MNGERVTLEELKRKVLDLGVSDRELRGFFLGEAGASRGLVPGITVNRQRVEVAREEEFSLAGDVLGGFFGRLYRLRRALEFNADIALDPRRPVIVAEGDSWFQFPALLQDVVDQLHQRGFAMRCDSMPGDTLANMLAMGQYLPAIEAQLSAGRDLRAFIFSAAGNDVIGTNAAGTSVLEAVLRPFEPGQDDPAFYCGTDAFAAQLQIVEDGYRRIAGEVARLRPDLPVIVHGYDHAIPGGHPGDPRHPSYAAPDEWLGRPLRRRGLLPPDLQRRVVAVMIDRLYERLGRVAQAFPRTVRVIDLRGTNAVMERWNDEIHPNDDGFARVAAHFAQALEAVA